VIEAWHPSLEFELRRLEHFTTKAAARGKVAAWIEDYDPTRRHLALGMRRPRGRPWLTEGVPAGVAGRGG
jgi:putative transposase